MTTVVYGQDLVDGDSSLSEQTLEFGVDMTDPTIAFADDYDDDNRHFEIPDAFVFEPEDDQSNVGNSGLHMTDGLLVGIQRRNASKTECPGIAETGQAPSLRVAEDVDCDCTWP